MEVAVKDPGAEPVGAVALEPGRHVVEPRDLRARVAGEGGVAVELPAPARDLALEIALGPSEVPEPDRDGVDLAERRDGVDECHAHAPPDPRIGGVQRGKTRRRVEAAHRLHQREAGTEDRGVRARGDEERVRHLRAAQGAEHPRLAAHRLVAVLALVEGRPPENVGTAGPLEAQQDVLCPASEQLVPLDRSAREPLRVHPLREPLEIDARYGRRPGRSDPGHCGSCARRIRASRSAERRTFPASSRSGWSTLS